MTRYDPPAKILMANGDTFFVVGCAEHKDKGLLRYFLDVPEGTTVTDSDIFFSFPSIDTDWTRIERYDDNSMMIEVPL